MEQDLRIALAVLNARVGRTDDNLSRTVRWAKAAHNAGAHIVCFPETGITGYANSTIVHSAAETVPGPSTGALSEASSRYGMVILAGVVEKDSEGRFYASHLVVQPEGSIGVYRKLHIAPREGTVFVPGDSVPIFEAGGARFGIELCYDAHFPALTTHMALRGVDMVFVPHASPRGTPAEKLTSWMRHLPARAYDNSIYVLACNQTGPNGDGLSFPGLAVAIGPSGRAIEKDISGGEGLLVVDLSAADLASVRSNAMHHFLPNRRPELYADLVSQTGEGDSQ